MTQQQQHDQFVANQVSIPFFLICFICNVIIIVVYFTAPKLKKGFQNRLILYQAFSDGIWSFLCILYSFQFALDSHEWSEQRGACIFFGTVRYFKVFYSMWDGFVAITMYFKIVRRTSTESFEKPAFAISVFWVILNCTLALSIFPSAPSHPTCSPTGPNAIYATQFLFLVSIYIIVLTIIVCYVMTARHVYSTWKKVGNRSEDRVHARAIRNLIFFPMITIIIWTPSIVRRSYETLYGYSFVGNVFQSIGLPLSGPLNLLIWGSTRKIWRGYECCSGKTGSSDDDPPTDKTRQSSEKTQPEPSVGFSVA